MGMNKAQYEYYSELASLSKGPDWIQYKRKDGAMVKFNIRTKEYVVYYDNGQIATYHNRRTKQVKQEMEQNGIKVPESLK